MVEFVKKITNLTKQTQVDASIEYEMFPAEKRRFEESKLDRKSGSFDHSAAFFEPWHSMKYWLVYRDPMGSL